MNICQVFRMQPIRAGQAQQMLMNKVVRPTLEVMCGEVLKSSRSLPVNLCLVTYWLSTYQLPCWPPCSVCVRTTWQLLYFISYESSFCSSTLRAIVVFLKTLFSLDCCPLIRQGYSTIIQVIKLFLINRLSLCENIIKKLWSHSLSSFYATPSLPLATLSLSSPLTHPVLPVNQSGICSSSLNELVFLCFRPISALPPPPHLLLILVGRLQHLLPPSHHQHVLELRGPVVISVYLIYYEV